VLGTSEIHYKVGDLVQHLYLGDLAYIRVIGDDYFIAQRFTKRAGDFHALEKLGDIWRLVDGKSR
jgi:hypothetical protein